MIPLGFFNNPRNKAGSIVSVLLGAALGLTVANALPIEKITAVISKGTDSGLMMAPSNLTNSSTARAGNSTAAIFSSVPPVRVEGSPTCSGIYPGSIELRQEPPGSGTLSDGYTTVTLSNVDVVAGTLGSWASNYEVLAVIMKGGIYANVYNYGVPGVTGDSMLVTPTNSANNKPYEISHISFCYKYKLNVTKTATTTFTRTYNWTIDKTVTPGTHNLHTGDSATSTYTVAVDKTGYTDSNWAINGTIAIYNPAPVPATINSLSDVISGVGSVTPDCGVGFPYPLASGGTLNCVYSSPLPDGASRTNSASATVSTPSFIDTSTGSANVVFGTPTTEVNASINVSDTNGKSWQAGDNASWNYTRTFSCNNDAGIRNNTAAITETGQSDSASVTVTCYALTVSKTAQTSLTRTWNWTIQKSADQSSALTLSLGQQFLVNYSVQVNATSTDSNWAVNGGISVHNPAPIAATIIGVADVISPVIPATVSCGVTFPYSLAAGATLTCIYTADLPDGASRTNTATATLRNYSYDSNGTRTESGTTDFSGTANVDFSSPTINKVDECIDVSDTYAGALGTVCEGQTLPKSFTYSRDIGPYSVCGNYTIDNTASFVTNDSGTTSSDSWEVAINVPCGGCNYTIGYWKTHAGFGPQADVVTQLLQQGIQLGNLSVTSAGQAVDILSMSGDASNGVNKLMAQLLAAKLNAGNSYSGCTGSYTYGGVTHNYSPDQAIIEFPASGWDTRWGKPRKEAQAVKQMILSMMECLDSFNNSNHCSE